MHRQYAVIALLLAFAPPALAAGKEAAGRDGGERCIPQSRVSGAVVRDDGQVYLPGSPNKADTRRVHFRGGNCPGIDRMSTLIVKTTGSGYCVGDHVQGVNLPATIPGPVCVIESFEKVPE